ncbi:class I SAM-dependent methyltransferase [Nostoc sp. FACHB-133]|uniref:class I SAM-dependent methyltransferase n=1 Tax=Nostoc sp. FACHB-133 TaxID=2692835 RepID=UPI00168539B4|nr:class I SAM-dependent methyltransferase [Nostoc sp. FACHB-133]MBD2525712.1 class I SAM-dependent methyltransferase [Nostoc sp. FACHB-133]
MIDPQTRISQIKAAGKYLPKHIGEWRNAQATFTEEKLEIFGHPVMEKWEAPYMKELANIVTFNGGKILEVGFGLGISARYIQEHEIEEHIIIEANAEVFVKLEEFAQQAKHKVTPIFGFWQDVVDSLPNDSFDGILFDSVATTEDEVIVYRYSFFEQAYLLLKKGGIFTHYTGEIDIKPDYRQLLNKAGFFNISGTLCSVNPPKDCVYWNEPVILAPIIIK